MKSLGYLLLSGILALTSCVSSVSAAKASKASKTAKNHGEHKISGTIVAVHKHNHGGTITVRTDHHGNAANQGHTKTFAIDHHTKIHGGHMHKGTHVVILAHHHHADQVMIQHHLKNQKKIT
jgi:hypothetical protein